MNQKFENRFYTVAEVQEAMEVLELVNLPSLAPALNMLKSKLPITSIQDGTKLLPFTSVDVELLEDAKPRLEQVFIHLIKRDLESDSALAEGTKAALREIAHRIGDPGPRIKAMDARLAFDNASLSEGAKPN